MKSKISLSLLTIALSTSNVFAADQIKCSLSLDMSDGTRVPQSSQNEAKFGLPTNSSTWEKHTIPSPSGTFAAVSLMRAKAGDGVLGELTVYQADPTDPTNESKATVAFDTSGKIGRIDSSAKIYEPLRILYFMNDQAAAKAEAGSITNVAFVCLIEKGDGNN